MNGRMLGNAARTLAERPVAPAKWLVGSAKLNSEDILAPTHTEQIGI